MTEDKLNDIRTPSTADDPNAAATRQLFEDPYRYYHVTSKDFEKARLELRKSSRDLMAVCRAEQSSLYIGPPSSSGNASLIQAKTMAYNRFQRAMNQYVICGLALIR